MRGLIESFEELSNGIVPFASDTAEAARLPR
jgi:hypothetical protein